MTRCHIWIYSLIHQIVCPKFQPILVSSFSISNPCFLQHFFESSIHSLLQFLILFTIIEHDGELFQHQLVEEMSNDGNYSESYSDELYEDLPHYGDEWENDDGEYLS